MLSTVKYRLRNGLSFPLIAIFIFSSQFFLPFQKPMQCPVLRAKQDMNAASAILFFQN